MTISAGTQLGQYKVLSALGAGGMGEVYRAQDSKLGRDVALKILPDTFTHDPDRLARFRREAQVLAALSHPNIGAIYGLEEVGGTQFLVLELLNGESLDKRIARGPIPLDEALVLAKQIAEAVEAAHEKGIVHRDLKPANIIVTVGENVKVLDFGLAKKTESAASVAATNSATVTSPTTVTGIGVIMGSAAYMSPEQAKGRETDKRSDVWAFGCVLYEMLCRKKPFPGETITEVLAAVIHTQPDWSALPVLPRSIDRLLRRCLQKDPRKRLHDLADARIEIEEALEGNESATPAIPPGKSKGMLPWIVTALVAVIAAFVFWNSSHLTSKSPRTSMRVTVPLPSAVTLSLGRGSSLALSPDGQTLVFAGNTSNHIQLYLRAVDREDATAIPGTEGATDPFFSPNGQWVGFFANGKLQKVALSGGAPMILAEAPNQRGETWGPDDYIYFTPRNNGGIWKVSANGGPVQEVTKVAKGEFSHRWPQILQGGKAILFVIWNDTGFEGGRVAVQQLPTGERHILVQGGGFARCIGPDADGRSYLVYAQASGIMGVSFDPNKLALAGQARPVLDNVLTNLSGGAHITVSSDGMLAYVAGTNPEGERTLIWMDRKGQSQEIARVRGMSLTFRLSPDDRRVARHNVLGASHDIWIEELDRGTSTRFTFEGINYAPIWSPDGKWIFFSSDIPNTNIFRKRSDGSGKEERITTGENSQLSSSFTPDGKTLVFVENDPVTGSDIWMVDVDGDRKPRPFLRTPFNEGYTAVSPDGKWIAYQSNESGRFEIYVAAFPDGGRKLQVSTEGGFGPIWAHNGRELFFQTNKGMMIANVVTRPKFTVERPRLLFEGRYEGTFNISSNDQRFLGLKGFVQEKSGTQVSVILNWVEELNRRVSGNN